MATTLDELAKQCGFENEMDLHRHVSGLPLTHEGILEKFYEWKELDGTKTGLLELYKIAGVAPHEA
jgi:hypothetical protein